MELKLSMEENSVRVEVKQDSEKTPRVALNLKGAAVVQSVLNVIQGEIQNYVNHVQEQQRAKQAAAQAKAGAQAQRRDPQVRRG